MSESFENDIEIRLTEATRLQEDTVFALADELEKFFSSHANIINSLATKVTPENWNEFSKQVSAEFSRFFSKRFNTEKNDGFKGMWGKVTGQNTDLVHIAPHINNIKYFQVAD